MNQHRQLRPGGGGSKGSTSDDGEVEYLYDYNALYDEYVKKIAKWNEENLHNIGDNFLYEVIAWFGILIVVVSGLTTITCLFGRHHDNIKKEDIETEKREVLK